MKVILIYKIIARIIWRVYINNIYLTHIGVLKQFQHFEVITFDIKILCILPVHTFFRARTQRLVDRCSSLTEGSTFPHPRKVINFRSILHSLAAQQQTEFIEIDYAMHFPILPHRFREAGRSNLVERIKIELCTVFCLLFYMTKHHFYAFLFVYEYFFVLLRPETSH